MKTQEGSSSETYNNSISLLFTLPGSPCEEERRQASCGSLPGLCAAIGLRECNTHRAAVQEEAGHLRYILRYSHHGESGESYNIFCLKLD